MCRSRGILLVLASCLLTLCSCSRADRGEVAKLKADLEAARAEAVAAKAELAQLKAKSNPDSPASDLDRRKNANSVQAKASGEFKFKNGKTRRFTTLAGVKGSQTPQLTWTYQKLPGEVFFSTVDRGELLTPLSKLTSITIRETDNTSNPEAEVVSITGTKQVFRYWVLSSLVDVTWDGSFATERIHLAGDVTISFDR